MKLGTELLKVIKESVRYKIIININIKLIRGNCKKRTIKNLFKTPCITFFEMFFWGKTKTITLPV